MECFCFNLFEFEKENKKVKNKSKIDVDLEVGGESEIDWVFFVIRGEGVVFGIGFVNFVL